MADSGFLNALLKACSKSWGTSFPRAIQARQAAQALDNALTNNVGIVPVGAIIAWTNHLTGTPTGQVDTALNTFTGKPFHVCDGSVVSDSLSPINGVTLPNLNSAATDPIFLGGYTASNATLVAANMPTHAHGAFGTVAGITSTWTTSHSHVVQQSALNLASGTAVAGPGAGGANVSSTTNATSTGITNGPDRATDGTSNNFPHHMKIIWIMRVR